MTGVRRMRGGRRRIEKEGNHGGRVHKSGNREELLSQAMNAGRLR